jgi:hypothetical protein
MIYKGVGGSLELLEDRLIIRRTMLLGTLVHGFKGEKSIPYSAITAVQYKRAGVMNGYIQFTLGGGNESKKGLWDAAKDENTLMFADNEAFEKARSYVEARMGVRAAPVGNASGSAADDLEKLAALRDRGILSDEEFAEQKAKVLGKTYSLSHTATVAAVTEVEEPPSEHKVRMMEAMEQAIKAAPSRPAGPSFGKRSAH